MRPRDDVLFLTDLTGLAGFLYSYFKVDRYLGFRLVD